jgi:ABC-type bacteriocin/lantibiotic exporter with double-glycine peptidase domain
MEFNEIPNAVIPLLNNLGAIMENLKIFAAEEEKEKPLIALEVQKVELQNISFSYNKDKYIFKNFSYTFQPGLYWVKGESGKGKSTLIKLLTGLLEPQEGIVIYNNTYSTKNYTLQKNISYMTQNDGIYGRTVMENITFEQPSPHITSYCQRFKMEDILHYKCEGGGLNISGGQIRRIGLLRLINFYNNGNVVIFDEPLVGLNEKLVEETVEFILSFKGIVIVCEHTNIIEKYHYTPSIVSWGPRPS